MAVTHSTIQGKQEYLLRLRLNVLHLFPDEGQRATLSQAIYEEWYFARRQQIHARKVKVKEEIRRKEEEKERVKFKFFTFLF